MSQPKPRSIDRHGNAYYHDIGNKYIAVFADDAEWRWLQLKPEDRFKRILAVEDIRGRKFDGVIDMYNQGIRPFKITDAYEQLKIKQPELFK